MKIKVCGMTQLAQIEALNKLKVDFIGFIFYPKSPRYALNQLTEEEIKHIKGVFKKVGVFVNASEEEILHTVESCGLDMVQLHGDEASLFCEKISERVPVIKAFRLLNNDDVLYKITPYLDVVDYFMFDTNTESFGGSGKKFDWNILRDLDINKPFFMSGGIGETDVESLLLFTKQNVAKDLFSLDINSRFEVLPGIKDVEKIDNFLDDLKRMHV
ncbi:phosphoribosylanthranilate isomerase [Arachidicoccus sp.]|uniref:phosphoribosylanthranilate isomerase n=1 Tax=Arachidicoccus sp. TaxID=1872624 RepID=UPI003D2636EC